MNIPIALHILRLISTGEAQTIDEIAAAAGVHRATAFRVLDDCRDQFGMTITWYPEHGRYCINQWGAINPAAIAGGSPGYRDQDCTTPSYGVISPS